MGCGGSTAMETQDQIKRDQAEYVKAARKAGPPLNPTGKIDTKTKTQAFCNLYDFAIGPEGFLWFKLRPDFPKAQISDYPEEGKKLDAAWWYAKEWHPLAFPGFFARTHGHDKDKGKTVVKEITADEGCLIAIDDKDEVFFRRIIQGHRDSYGIAPGKYTAASMLHTGDWDPRWFSIPVLHYIEDLFRGGDLEYPEGARCSAISIRGPLTDFSEDADNRRIPDRQDGESSYQIIQLYVLEKYGRRIRLYDPWAPKYAPTYVHLPETLRTSFYATNMSCAGGTVFVIGYECDRLAKTKKLKAYTRLVDMDSAGWNPILKYDFTADDESPGEKAATDRNLLSLLRILPWQPEWYEQSLPQGDGVELTELVTVIQTPYSWDSANPVDGTQNVDAAIPQALPPAPEMRLPGTVVDAVYKTGGGRRARELRINGTEGGKKGYFRKMVASYESWSFVQTAGYLEAPALPLEGVCTKPLAPCDTQDYIGTATFMRPAGGWIGKLFGQEREQVRYKVRVNGFGVTSNIVKIYFFPLADDCGDKDDDVCANDAETCDFCKGDLQAECAQAHCVPGVAEGQEPHRVIEMFVRDNITVFLPPWVNRLADFVLPDDITDKYSHNVDLVSRDPGLDVDLRHAFKVPEDSKKPFSYSCSVFGQHTNANELRIATKDEGLSMNITNLKPIGTKPTEWVEQ